MQQTAQGRRRRDSSVRSSANWAALRDLRPKEVARQPEQRAKRMERQIADQLAHQGNYEGDGRPSSGLRT